LKPATRNQKPVRMSEHGFLQPNPALFLLENRKKKSGLAHELGAGAACLKCGGECSGFQLHFWRKVCMNCRCGKAEHAVVEDSDHGDHFVGKIFDRPLRSREEERKFIFGEVVEEGAEEGGAREVTLAWAPPGVPSMLATKYLRALPQEHLSIQGSEGAQRRLAALERQFPLHDVEPGQCHQLSRGEIDSMSSYVDNVRRNVAGQGRVEELTTPPPSLTTPPPCRQQEVPRECTPSPPPPLPPPPMELLVTDPLSYTSGALLPPPPPMGTFHAEPYRGPTDPYRSPGEPYRSSGDPYGSSDPYRSSSDPYMSPSDPYRGAPDPYRPHLPSSSRHRGSTGSSIASTSPSPPHSSPTPIHQAARSKAWTCSGCSLPMMPGSVAIFAERAGHDRCWHPTCFRCSTCGDRLEDLLYFYSKGRLYCGRDFADLMKIPRCNACDELIFSTEYTGAEGGAYHLKHFCCWVCDAPLAGHKYIAEAGQPHCLPCWQHHHGKVCSSCGQVIDPQGQRVSLGEQHWHASEECFRCGVCDKNLLGGKMSKRGSTLLCSSECGQQLAQLKQQQAALITRPASSLSSPRPSPAPSGRNSPVPGLVPGLARLGLGDGRESPRDGRDSPRYGVDSPRAGPGVASPRHGDLGRQLPEARSASYSTIV